MFRFSRSCGPARLAAAIAGLLVAIPAEVFAQMEEVIVTTRKREEPLQDIPIAVSAITDEQITRQGISDLADVAKLTPSLQFDTSFGPQDVRITVRGLSNTRGRSNVAFLVDSIDVTTENVISAGSGLLANRRLLTDVERIEVVKGPQSALYGRAAFAGAINYVTKEPGEEFEGKVSADAGDYGRYTVESAFGGPVLGDVLGLRLAGVYWNEDGYWQNSVSGADVGGGEGYGAALTGVLRPMESMKWKGRLEFSDEEYDPAPTVRVNGSRFLRYPGDSNILDPVDCAAQTAQVVADRQAAGLPPPAQIDCFPGRMTESATPFFLGLYNSSVQRGDPDRLPIAVPASFGDADGKEIRLSENPLTGSDYPGDDIQVFRASLVGTWDLGVGTVSSYTGYTDGEFSQYYDQDYQARGLPDTLVADQEANTDSTTRQFTQELRFQTQLDGPVQFTGGVLYWEEERDLSDNNYIVACLPTVKDPLTDGVIYNAPGICDGTAGSVTSWQQYVRQLAPNAATLAAHPEVANYPGADWQADTDHWSYYVMLEWSLSDALKLTFEERFVVEEFFLREPNQSSCTNLGFATLAFLAPLLDEQTNPGFDAMCESVNTLVNGYIPQVTTQDWQYISGTENSRFNTPKITLDWRLSEDHLVYFSWAHAQKPGGLNQLSPGGEPVDIDDQRFLPEKMEAWELGAKTTWNAGGMLQLNSALFYQDYTDKQVTTQVVVGEQLQPRVVNAAAAEVWGAELELLWQPEFLEGLTLTAAYTYLDAEYVDFIQNTRSIARVSANGQCVAVPVVTTADQGNTDPADDVVTVTPFCQVDFSGQKLERTPENALVAGVQLQRPFLDTRFEWLAEISANFQDDRFIDEDNYAKFDSYWLVDARLGLTSEATEFLLYVENLFDDDTLKSGGSGPDFAEQVSDLGFTAGLGVSHYFGPLPDPRVVGVRVNYRF